MKHGIIHLLIFICFAACFYGCRSSRSCLLYTSRTRVPDPAGLVGGRTVHQSWQEEPEYRPDANGEIRNRDFFGGDLRGVIEELDLSLIHI